MGESFARSLSPFSEEYLGRIQETISRTVFTPEFREALRRSAEPILRMVPDNLRPLSVEQWNEALAVSSNSRIGLAWSPRTEIVAELLKATDGLSRDRVLLEHSSDIMADCRQSLLAISHPSLDALPSFAVKAIDAYLTGHHEAAQALATNVLDTALEQKSGGVKAALKSLKAPLSNDDSIRRFRLLAAGAGVHPSYYQYKYEGRDPQYSRNGTAHAVNTELYRDVNAIKAVMLTSSWLRLLDELAYE
jgi:hypothetical protein